MITFKEKVIAQLIKWGNNPITANQIVEENFDFAYRCYGPESINKGTPAKVAKVIRTVA